MKKKLIHDVLSYYIDTTGEPVESLIMTVTRCNRKKEEELSDKEWLAVSSFKFLSENGITLADCLDYRELATQLKLEKRGMNISDLWKDKISECLNLFDMPKFTLFDVSDNDSELSFYGRKIGKPVYCFENEGDNNFFNTFDFDIDKDSRVFYNMLPIEIQNAISYNNRIFVNVNPYLEQDKDIDSILDEMKLYTFSDKRYQNIFFATMFRLMRFCKEYNLTNVRIGFYTPLDMFNGDEDYAPFYKEFKSYFKFNSGVCFDPKQLGVKSKDKLIGYTIWDRKQNKNEEDNAVVLTQLIQHTDDTILSGSMILLRAKSASLYSWVKNSVIKYGETTKIPVYNNIQHRSSEFVDRYENVLGYLLNSPSAFRNFKKIGAFTVPIQEYTEITKENLLKSVASFVVCDCLATFDETHSQPPYLSMPDTSMQGYSNWIADALVYFMFNPLNMTKSYRERDFKMANRLFPISKRDIMLKIQDCNLLDDAQNVRSENEDFLSVIDTVYNDISKEGMDLYMFCKKKILQSVSGTYRENAGYKDSLDAWDASFYQIRSIPNLFSAEEEKQYVYLVSQLKGKLNAGVYKYGFVIQDF